MRDRYLSLLCKPLHAGFIQKATNNKTKTL